MSEVFAAVLGALVVWITTYYTEYRRTMLARRNNSAHLGVVVLVHLDRFISDCYSVAKDNGTVLGQAAGRHDNGEEYYFPQTDVPQLHLEDLKVEWRSISPSLMYSIHSIPLQIRDTLEYLEHVAEIGDFEGSDYMDSRQERFAEIGVGAADIAAALRKETGIPAKPFRKWGAENQLRARHQVYQAKNEARQAAHDDYLAEANSHDDTKR